MAKVPFSKLQASINGCDACISYANRAGEEVKYEVKHYLPFADKLELVSRVINQSIDNNGFYNPMKIKLYMTLEIVYAYTNLNFTEKMKEDPFKLYDILVSTGIYNDITTVIYENDLTEIKNSVYETIESIYKYQNSIMGVLEAISANYSDLKLDISELKKDLAESNDLSFLKEVMDKLG